jgi:hypothetical protein
MSTGLPTPKKTSPPSKQKSGSKMTRAVANLNRQKAVSSEGQNPPNGIPSHTESTSTSTPTTSPSKSNKPSPQKLLPPQPSAKGLESKQLPDVPEFYVVRPAPSTSSAKVERNDRRVFISRGTMEKINVCQGSVVLVQRHYPSNCAPTPPLDSIEKSEEDQDSNFPINGGENIEQTAVGIAWPMDRIEPNGIHQTLSN